jgi:hypothetical protein
LSAEWQLPKGLTADANAEVIWYLARIR